MCQPHGGATRSRGAKRHHLLIHPSHTRGEGAVPAFHVSILRARGASARIIIAPLHVGPMTTGNTQIEKEEHITHLTFHKHPTNVHFAN